MSQKWTNVTSSNGMRSSFAQNMVILQIIDIFVEVISEEASSCARIF